MAFLMGIDLGTSSLKVVVINEQGNLISQASRNYQFSSPRNGYAEQEVKVWWEACKSSIREAITGLKDKGANIAAVSFSGQMHGLVAFDREDRVIRPAILHCDARSSAQVEHMKELLGKEFIINKIKNPIYTGFLLPSLLWMREREPENFERIKKVCLPKDYLKFLLCGELSTDYSDGSATLAFDIDQLVWSKEILEKVKIPQSFFPNCRDTYSVAGQITGWAAKETGLSEGTLVVNGGADQVMQGVGNGITRLEAATVNIGTSGQVCFQSDKSIENPMLNTNTFCGYEKGRWIVMGATMSAGLSLHWLNQILQEQDYKLINEKITEIKPGSGGLIFLPYLNGERTPHVNPNLSSMFLGMNVNTGRYELIRAVMEGVTYSLRQCIEVCSQLGLKADTLVASGGGARSKPWLQLQADIYNIPVKTAKKAEQAGVGAAIVAGVGAGIYPSIEEGCLQVIEYEDRIYEPNHKNHAIYQEYYQLFKDTYQSNQEILQRVTQLGRRER
jgi:xylulokinase